jgi:hypothetical protein
VSEDEDSGVTCPECGKTFKNGSGLTGHLRMVHGGHTKEGDYKEYVDGALTARDGVLARLQSTVEEQTRKIKALGTLLESVALILHVMNDDVHLSPEDIKTFESLGVHPKRDTLDMVKSSE